MKIIDFAKKYSIGSPNLLHERTLWESNKNAEVIAYSVHNAYSSTRRSVGYAFIFRDKKSVLKGFINGRRSNIKDVISFIRTSKVEKEYDEKMLKRIQIVEEL